MTAIISPDDARRISVGGLVIFPTETIYGLGCVATDADAVRRVFEAKGRAPSGEAFKPPPVLVADDAQLQMLVERVPSFAQEWMQAHWPGALTLVLPARRNIAPLLLGLAEDGSTPTIGVRRSAHPIAQALGLAIGAPIVATSANFSGAMGAAAAPRTLDDVDAELRARVDVVLDGGVVAGVPSTVVDCTGVKPRVLRQGAIQLANVD